MGFSPFFGMAEQTDGGKNEAEENPDANVRGLQGDEGETGTDQDCEDA